MSQTHRDKLAQSASGNTRTGGPAASPSIGPENKIILDARTLSYVLSKTHPADVSKTLQASLQSATPEEIRTLSKLLRPLLPKALIKKMCVRCEKEYLESENTEHSCEVPHCADPEEYMDPDSEWPDDASEGPPEQIIYPCCESVYDVDRKEYGQDTCYTAQHTTDSAEIDYYGFEAKLEQRRAKRAKLEAGLFGST